MTAGDWATAGLTAVLVVVTGYYAWQNQRMVKEMRRARELSVAPHLALVLWPVASTTAFPRVINVGQGPALDVDFTVVFEAAPGTGATSETRRWTSSLMAVGHHQDFITPESPRHEMQALTIKQLGERYRAIRLQGSMRDAFGNRVPVADVIDDVGDWQRITAEANVVWERDWPERLLTEIEQLRKSIDKLER